MVISDVPRGLLTRIFQTFSVLDLCSLMNAGLITSNVFHLGKGHSHVWNRGSKLSLAAHGF